MSANISMRLNVPFYRQSTDFTCDPASLMMALGFFNSGIKLDRRLEFDIWRESYGIGIPGCLPQGLAVAGLKRGLSCDIVCPVEDLIGVSNELASGEGNEITKTTSKMHLDDAKELGVSLTDECPTVNHISDAISKKKVPLAMINMKRLHDIDSPHWVVIVGVDEKYVYFHDPYSDKGSNQKCRISEFEKMMEDLSSYSKICSRMLMVSG